MYFRCDTVFHRRSLPSQFAKNVPQTHPAPPKKSPRPPSARAHLDLLHLLDVQLEPQFEDLPPDVVVVPRVDHAEAREGALGEPYQHLPVHLLRHEDVAVGGVVLEAVPLEPFLHVSGAPQVAGLWPRHLARLRFGILKSISPSSHLEES